MESGGAHRKAAERVKIARNQEFFAFRRNAALSAAERRSSPLTTENRGAILEKYFGNALAAVCGVSRISDNRTDERHRGSQLKVPKETGIFSRKNGPVVFFCFPKAGRFVRFARTNPISGKTVVWKI